MLEVVILIAVQFLTQIEFNRLLLLLSAERQDRIKTFHFFRDAQNSLLGEILVRNEISRITGLENGDLQISANKYGKPLFMNNPNMHFNISHAGHYVVCAISEQPVGIDIEIIKPIELKIAERFFTAGETAYIMAADQLARFYEVWTKKESQIKWEGKGLHKPLTSFSVFDPSEPVTYHKVFQNDEAICHVCSAKKTLSAVKLLDIPTFLNSLII